MEATRREVLLASAALPLAAAVVDAPLTREELRILAMTATPAEVWNGREDEYYEDPERIVAADDAGRNAILESLQDRGLIQRTEAPWSDCVGNYRTATEAGLAELRKVGAI